MARVKKGVNAHKRHKKVLKMAKGFYGAKSKTFKAAKPGYYESSSFSIRRKKEQEERIQKTVDRKNQRSSKNERYLIQQTYGRSQEIKHRYQQKDAFRDGYP